MRVLLARTYGQSCSRCPLLEVLASSLVTGILISMPAHPVPHLHKPHTCFPIEDLHLGKKVKTFSMTSTAFVLLSSTLQNKNSSLMSPELMYLTNVSQCRQQWACNSRVDSENTHIHMLNHSKTDIHTCKRITNLIEEIKLILSQATSGKATRPPGWEPLV